MRTFTAGRTGDNETLATEPTLLDVLSVLQGISVALGGTTFDVVTGSGTVTLLPAASGALVASYTVPTGKKILITGVSAGGDGDGKFTLTVNGTDVWTGRNSWAQKNSESAVEIKASAGSIITFTAQNTSTFGNTNNYYGSWWGELT
jgi:hypothetical protein